VHKRHGGESRVKNGSAIGDSAFCGRHSDADLITGRNLQVRETSFFRTGEVPRLKFVPTPLRIVNYGLGEQVALLQHRRERSTELIA
jgi:hypothetical protein